MSNTRTVEESYGDMQIEVDPIAQRREWMATRVALVAMGVIIALSLTGALGQGPLSHYEVASADGVLRASYERIMRLETVSSLEVRLRPTAAQARLTLAGKGWARLRIEDIHPGPQRIEGHGVNETTYVFEAQPGQDLIVALRIKPYRPGPSSAEVRLENGPAIRLPLVMLP